MKYHLFCSRGGCGSTALNRSLLRRGYTQRHSSKPDLCFTRPEYTSGNHELYENRQLLSERGYDDVPYKPEAIAEFHRRTGIELDTTRTIRDNLLAFVEHLRAHQQTALFNTAPIMAFFSEHDIESVVFLVRHPLHAYVSWTKPERHLNVVEQLGGRDSTAAISLFARMWTGVVEEYLRLSARSLNPVLIRYETAEADVARQAPELSSVFRGWDSSRRNAGVLPSSKEAFLEGHVREAFFTIYQEWDLPNPT